MLSKNIKLKKHVEKRAWFAANVKELYIFLQIRILSGNYLYVL
jgi:hypothetical protein